ncbi:MAG: hypothetical protein JXB10_19420, partial [Pirellulales bacterium]|nr:hypothetical protein [Pirellulales bacterium]
MIGGGDDSVTFVNTYDDLGRTVRIATTSDDLAFTAWLDRQYDGAGRRIVLSAATDNGQLTPDFVNGYAYDAAGRMTQVTQQGQSGGTAVAEKHVDFTYNASGNFYMIRRYADLAGTEWVVNGQYAYDAAGRVTRTHASGANSLYDEYDFFTLDVSDQILTASLNSESYQYDDNGNRTEKNSTPWETESGNRLLRDGDFTYTYDPEGNRAARFIDNNSNGVLDSGDTEVTLYGWDYHNRLVDVVFKAAFTGTISKQVWYTYDSSNRQIRRVEDSD